MTGDDTQHGATKPATDITVIGCGIIGLTSAVRLQESGYRVRILARDVPPHTTSNKAAAIWEPYQVAPEDKVDTWAAASYRIYAAQADVAGSGIHMVEWIMVCRETSIPRPYWVKDAYRPRHLDDSELPSGYRAGLAVTVPFIHSGIYLHRLVDRYRGSGGQLEQRILRSLDEVDSAPDAIVNCSGLGARELADDGDVVGIRGQLAVVRSRPGLRCIGDDFTYDPEPVYIFPRGDEVMLGGTAQYGREDVDEDPAIRQKILERCRALEPSLASSEFLRSVVGIRPGRREIRLELERRTAGPPVIHNYGHGGAGFTTAWGCAEEVLSVVRKLAKWRGTLIGP